MPRLLSFFGLLCFCLCGAQSVFGFEPPPLTGPVVDQADIIDSSDRAYLESQIRNLHDSQRIQLQILTLSSLQNEPIEQASIDTVDKWKLGDKDTDKGLLILVAPNEKKVRIEVGQGLEGDVPDVLAYQIIQQKILPAFRGGSYGKGLIAAVGAIEALTSPETAGKVRHALGAQQAQQQKDDLSVLSVFFFVIGLFIFFQMLLNILVPRRRRRGFWAGVFLGGGGRGGFGGGGGGGFGGGGWSGGGGGFSGGGASGGW